MQKGDLAYRDLTGEIIAYLADRMGAACDHGIEKERLIVDPGLGFGKTGADNVNLIRRLQEFRCLGRPIITGASRKAFIGSLTGGRAAERFEGTAAAVTAAIMNGSHIVRVHDVEAMRKVVAVADAICGGMPS